MIIQDLPDGFIVCVNAMLNDASAWGDLNPKVLAFHLEMKRIFVHELIARDLKSFIDMNVYSDLDSEYRCDFANFDFSEYSDNELYYWYGVGSAIVDFSCLGRGVRDYATLIWDSASKELDKRNLEYTFLFELEFK